RKEGTGPKKWAADLLVRKPYNVVAVALANKMARIAWAIMVSGERFRSIPA
ncbi:IS110 family transposase, partial [Agrobacterium sp. MCAB5]